MSEEEICELYLSPEKGNNYINKDKIRDKIKELDDLNSKFSQRVINSKERYFTEMIQNILKELLEEK